MKTFQIAYTLLYKNTNTHFNNIPFTPEDFSNYFTSKRVNIRSKVELRITKLSNKNPYAHDQPLTNCTILSNVMTVIFLHSLNKLVHLQYLIPSL